MTEVDRLADQLERGYRGDAWHGTPLATLLAGVDPASASTHPLSGAHSVWEITHHIAAWMEIARRRLAGETVRPTDSEDWPPVGEPTPARWADAKAALDSAHARLLAAVQRLTDADLERVVPVMGYTNYVMLHGVLQHSLYHAGQIALLGRPRAGAGQ